MAKNSQPSVPQLSQEERDLLQKQGVSLDQFNSILSKENINATQNQGLLQGISGLYNPDGTINQEAADSLRQRTLAQQQQQEALGGQGLSYLQSVFGAQPNADLNSQINQTQAQQYLAALQGGTPVSQALTQQEADQFKKLSEAAGQRGIRISGDDLFTATSDSTAGNQLLSQLRKDAQLNRENQRQNDLNRLQAANMSSLGFGLQQQGQLANIAGSTQYAPGQASLGYLGSAQQMGPGSLLGQYQNLSNSYGAAAQPYQNQRYLQYQADLQGAANSRAAGSGMGSLLGGIAGAGIGSLGGPGGTMLGFGIGSGLGGAVGSGQLSPESLFSLGAGGLAYGLYKNKGVGATSSPGGGGSLSLYQPGSLRPQTSIPSFSGL